jgi:hypothetical protein
MPESSDFNKFWMPDQVRHDAIATFYGAIKLGLSKKIPATIPYSGHHSQFHIK